MERWKPIKDYEGLYEVSDLGNVKSLYYKQTKNEKILKVSFNKRLSCSRIIPWWNS